MLPFSIYLIQNALYDTAYRLLHTLERFLMPFSQSLNFKSTVSLLWHYIFITSSYFFH